MDPADLIVTGCEEIRAPWVVAIETPGAKDCKGVSHGKPPRHQTYKHQPFESLATRLQISACINIQKMLVVLK